MISNSEFVSRTVRILGKDGVEKLENAHILLVGLGGVGGYVLEGLVRAGVGRFTLVDCDVFSESNLNRQILATRKTLGRKKTEVARERVLEINPEAAVEIVDSFLNAENVLPLFENENGEVKYDYVIDAIDSVTAKLAIAAECDKREIPFLSSMGTGNHLDPSSFVIGDIEKSTVCPLARVMRQELRKRGIRHVQALWSTENPIGKNTENGERLPPASVSFVPSVAGLMIAGYVVRRLCGIVEN